MAMAAFLVAVVQMALLPSAFGGAYYGHKPHPQQHQPIPQMHPQQHQPIPQMHLQQHQPMPQMHHMGMGKDIPHKAYPHYPPVHLNKGKDNKGMRD